MSKLFEFVKRYSKILFSIYMGFVVLVLVLKFPTGLVTSTVKSWMDGGDVVRMTPQLIPFKTITFYVQQVRAVYDWFFKNLSCNVIMFVPYGFLTPLFMKAYKYMWVKVLGTAMILSVFIEIFQYAMALGLCDIDDVILNVVGALLGYGIYKLVFVLLNKRK